MSAGIVGYRLIEVASGETVGEWGGQYGVCPAVPNPLILPNGLQVCGAEIGGEYEGYRLDAWEMERPPRTLIDGAEFLGRVTDDEYAAITGSDNVQVRRWLDIFRLRGEIDVEGSTARAAKAGLIAAGLLSQDRAERVFAAA